MRENRFGRSNCERIGSKPTCEPITNKPMGSGLTRRGGGIDLRNNRYSSRIVGTVDTPRISEPRMRS